MRSVYCKKAVLLQPLPRSAVVAVSIGPLHDPPFDLAHPAIALAPRAVFWMCGAVVAVGLLAVDDPIPDQTLVLAGAVLLELNVSCAHDNIGRGWKALP